MGNRKITLRTVKNRENIHPYSRKAHQLSRVYQRREKMSEKEKKKAANPKGERWVWFRYAFDEEKPAATKAELQELVEIYLQRHDEEINELEAARTRGHNRKAKTPRQEFLEALKESETNEYIAGMELPDMTNGKMLKLLREWDGDKNGMSRIRTIRVHKPVTTATTSNVSTETAQKQNNDTTNNDVKKAVETDRMEE
ncbi:hypothetical protein BDF20DRAFT_986804 [Mycotypha africana]|uniref:uncharacterized protein n=1 Tax=Mycotypha africana TaxID=64632 RepID=UPI002301124D|nr:uncharacterized protein BDF20DRAFT_986804 [Mycotypha africana]KAI8981789.1 hypothetical protein BDF20DRAFT_986804 [Mycotypha africana]